MRPGDFVERRDDFPAKPEVQRQLGSHLPVIHGIDAVLRLAETLRQLTYGWPTADCAKQETGKGVACVVQEAGQVRLSRIEVKNAGIRERPVVIEVPVVLIAETEAVLAVNPCQVILVRYSFRSGAVHKSHAELLDAIGFPPPWYSWPAN